MEPTSLTCAKCGTSWKVIKAGTGPVTCPNCKVPLDLSPPPVPAEPPAPAAEPLPAAPTSPLDPASPVAESPAPIRALTPAGTLPPIDIPDTDDPGLRADYDDRPDRRRSGMHPLVKVLIVLLILMVLVPVAVVILLLVVCAVMLSGR